MILYVNGDSHTAAAEAVNAHAFAEDDPFLNYLGRLPHPANLAVSWGNRLSNNLRAGFHCDAESAASNARIIRTTQDWIRDYPATIHEILIIIQWSTWERTEWLINNKWYQINASGADQIPDEYQQQYKEYIAGIDLAQKIIESHELIWKFHQELNNLNINHIFFNGNNHFGVVHNNRRYDWGISYIEPYNPKMTYTQWLLDNKHDTVSPNSYHFGKDAHAAWARFMLQYIVKHKLI